MQISDVDRDLMVTETNHRPDEEIYDATDNEIAPGLDMGPESEYVAARPFKYSLWIMISIIIVIAGLAISNGYAINNINTRLNKNSLNMVDFQSNLVYLIERTERRANEKICGLETKIERLVKKYDQITEQEGDMLLLFKRLSDQYNIMSQQLRDVNSEPTADAK